MSEQDKPVACACTNPWAHDQCTNAPGCKVASKLAARPVLTDGQIESHWLKSDIQPQLWDKARCFAEGAQFAERHHGIVAATQGSKP